MFRVGNEDLLLLAISWVLLIHLFFSLAHPFPLLFFFFRRPHTVANPHFSIHTPLRSTSKQAKMQLITPPLISILLLPTVYASVTCLTVGATATATWTNSASQECTWSGVVRSYFGTTSSGSEYVCTFSLFSFSLLYNPGRNKRGEEEEIYGKR